MKLTIIPVDGAVYKDGYSFSGLVLSGAPANVHALQWDGDTGWIEYVNQSEFRKPPNENITELPAWALDAVAKWDAVKAEYDAMLLSQPVSEGAQPL